MTTIKAAVGGAAEITASGTANVQLAVAHDAAANGFTNGVSGVSITANNPPLSGIYSLAQLLDFLSDRHALLFFGQCR